MVVLWHNRKRDKALFGEATPDKSQWGFGLYVDFRTDSNSKTGWVLHLILPLVWLSLDYTHWLPIFEQD